MPAGGADRLGRTTINELQDALALFDGSRRVSVVVEDATEDEEVFGEFRQSSREKHGI